MEFIKGKWYELHNNNYIFYVKVLKVENNVLFFEDGRYINHVKQYDRATYIEIDKINKSYLLNDLSKIRKYLPKGHLDLKINYYEIY